MPTQCNVHNNPQYGIELYSVTEECQEILMGKIERKAGNVTACKFKLIQCLNYPSNPFIVRLRKKERLKARIEEQLLFSHRVYSSGVMISIAQAQPKLIISTRVL